MINKLVKENNKKTSLQIFRFILVSIVLGIFYYMLFTEFSIMDRTEWAICLVMLFVISVITIYIIIYNLVLKHNFSKENKRR